MAIFKIFQLGEWQAFKQSDVFKGSPDDLRDGFIHFSTQDQLAGTLTKYYHDKPRIIIAHVDASNWGEALKWEISRGGASFPHLYSALKMADVMQHWEMSKATDEPWDLTEIEAALQISFAPTDV